MFQPLLWILMKYLTNISQEQIIHIVGSKYLEELY